MGWKPALLWSPVCVCGVKQGLCSDLTPVSSLNRNKDTTRDEFIFYSKRLMRLLIEHALSFLPLKVRDCSSGAATATSPPPEPPGHVGTQLCPQSLLLSFLQSVTVETPQGTMYEGKRFHRQRVRRPGPFLPTSTHLPHLGSAPTGKTWWLLGSVPVLTSCSAGLVPPSRSAGASGAHGSGCFPCTMAANVFSSLAQITGVSILRAGETMEQALTAVCKDIRLGKILIQTNHDTGEPEVSVACCPSADPAGTAGWVTTSPSLLSSTTCAFPRRSARTTSFSWTALCPREPRP